MPQIFLTKTEWEASPHKAQCKLLENGMYQLDGTNLFIDTQDPAKLKSALDAERAEKDKSALELKMLKERMDGVDSEAAKKAAAEAAEAKLKLEGELVKNKDIQGLLDQVKADNEAREASLRQELADRDAKQAEEKSLADAAIVQANAKAFCAKHFGDDEGVLAPLLIPRLRNGVGNQLSAVDSEGNPMDMKAFEAEVLANPVLAPMIQASKGSGVGDTRNVGSPVDIGDKTFEQLDSDERMELFKKNPEQYHQLETAADSSANFDDPGSML